MSWYEDYVTNDEVYDIMNLPEEDFMEYMGELIEFYREHPVEGVYDILGLGLTEYQKVQMIDSWNAKNIYWCQSRGSGKSFMMAIYVALYTILYPNEAVLMLAPSYRQSLMLYDKIMSEVYNKSFSFRYELEDNARGSMQAYYKIKNMSTIKFLPVGDGNKIRGERATMLFLDEHAQHDQSIIDRVIMPMLISDLNYDPDNPDREAFQATVICATSAYFQFNHSYKTFQSHLQRMATDKDYYCSVIPYNIPLSVNLYNEKFVAKQKRDMSSDDFEMEMNCKWVSGNEDAFITIQTWDKGIKYEETLQPLFKGRENHEYVLFADIAREEGGDNASLKIGEIRGTKIAIVREKALNGKTYQEITNQIREFCRDFNIITIWMDKFGGGTAVRDLLADEWFDYETQKTYPPILEIDSPRNDGIKMLEFVVANAELNHHMGHLVKKHIEQGNFIFPTLMDRYPDDHEMEMAYLDLIMVKKEVTNIQAIPSGNFHRFAPTKGSNLRKDRWTTMCYSALYIEERLLLREDDGLIIEVI